jgi:hypothetical protein
MMSAESKFCQALNPWLPQQGRAASYNAAGDHGFRGFR